MAGSLRRVVSMKQLSSVVLLACVFVVGLAFAQDPPQGTPTPKQSDSPKVTVTGCLTKSTAANEYVITDLKTGEKTPFSGPAQLDKYLNQTVKLTGSIASQGGERVFKPESINQVAAT